MSLVQRSCGYRLGRVNGGSKAKINLPELGRRDSHADILYLVSVGIYHLYVMVLDATYYSGSEMATPQRMWVFVMIDCAYNNRSVRQRSRPSITSLYRDFYQYQSSQEEGRLSADHTLSRTNTSRAVKDSHTDGQQ